MSFHLVSANKVLRLARLTALCKYCSKTHSTLFIFQSSILLRFRYLFVYPVSFTYVVFVPFSYVFFFLLEVAVCNSKNQNRINLDSYLPIYTFAPCFFFFFHGIPSSSLFCAWKFTRLCLKVNLRCNRHFVRQHCCDHAMLFQCALWANFKPPHKSHPKRPVLYYWVCHKQVFELLLLAFYGCVKDLCYLKLHLNLSIQLSIQAQLSPCFYEIICLFINHDEFWKFLSSPRICVVSHFYPCDLILEFFLLFFFSLLPRN